MCGAIYGWKATIDKEAASYDNCEYLLVLLSYPQFIGLSFAFSWVVLVVSCNGGETWFPIVARSVFQQFNNWCVN